MGQLSSGRNCTSRRVPRQG